MPDDPLIRALRELIKTWRNDAERHEEHGDCYRRGQGWALRDCGNELAALLRRAGSEPPQAGDYPTAETQHWAASVARNGENIVTIESNCLSGRDLSAEDERVIRHAAEHLRSFVGVRAGSDQPEPRKESMTNDVQYQQLADAAEMLWVVLCNVSGGDWTRQSQEWQDAAARWRDNYFTVVRAGLPAPPEPKE